MTFSFVTLSLDVKNVFDFSFSLFSYYSWNRFDQVENDKEGNLQKEVNFKGNVAEPRCQSLQVLRCVMPLLLKGRFSNSNLQCVFRTPGKHAHSNLHTFFFDTFQYLCNWILLFSGTWYRVVWYIAPNFREKTFFFNFKDFYSEDRSSWILRYFGKHKHYLRRQKYYNLAPNFILTSLGVTCLCRKWNHNFSSVQPII